MIAVLCGAALHALWNTLVKAAADTWVSTALVAGGAAVIAVLVLPFLPAPAAASWPHIAISSVLQVAYFALVAAAYRAADMSFAYPLMRGTAPVLVALVSLPVLGEALTPSMAAGVGLISAGVLTMVSGRRGPGGRGMRAAGLALANAVVIALYSLNDGMGVRLSGSPAAYTLWIYFLGGVPVVLWVAVLRGRALAEGLRRGWMRALGGGLANALSYGLALWAMTRAPVASVAALRESAIVFALAIATLVLHERLTAVRLAATVLIVAGAVAMRLG